VDGITLVWRQRSIGGKPDHIIISVNALIILICALFTIRTARRMDVPMGFDPETFTGPFLTILALLVYIFPQVLVLGYFKARETPLARIKLPFALLLLVVTAGMAVGIFAATMGMWLPKMLR
jgi:hypothetical protein